MYKKIVLFGCIVSMTTLLSFAANVKIDQKDIDQINKYEQYKNNEGIDDAIEAQIEAYADKMGFEFGVDEKTSKYFIYSVVPVAQKPTDPDFIKSLSIAYEKAFFAAQQEFIMDVFGRMVSQKESELFSDNSTNNREFASDKMVTKKGTLAKIGRIFNKVLSLTEKKLDKALIKLGVSPSELQSMSEKEKKTLFRNKFIASTMKEAYGYVSGFVPIKTFVGRDKSGQYAVGVIAMRSPKTSQVAKDIAMQRESNITGHGKPIREFVPTDKKALLSEMGIRLVFDESGRPAIISYGIWGFNGKGLDSYMKAEAKKNAKSMAKDMADSMIADFVNGYMSIKSQKQHGEIISKTIERESPKNAPTVEKCVKNIIDKINKQATIRSSMNMAGTSTVRKWSTLDENNLNVVGVVRKWTFGGLSAAKSVIYNKNKKTYSKNKKKTYTKTIKQSSEYNTVNDF